MAPSQIAVTHKVVMWAALGSVINQLKLCNVIHCSADSALKFTMDVSAAGRENCSQPSEWGWDKQRNDRTLLCFLFCFSSLASSFPASVRLALLDLPHLPHVLVMKCYSSFSVLADDLIVSQQYGFFWKESKLRAFICFRQYFWMKWVM